LKHLSPENKSRSAMFCSHIDARAAAEDDVFGLNGQIEHKLAFIREHIPKGSSLVLVGHSIGCYIILEMMRRNPELKVLKAVMLFPTIERMAESPQGRRMTPLLCQMRYLAYLPVFLLSLLPDILKAALIKLVFSNITSLDHCILQPTVQLLRGDSAGLTLSGLVTIPLVVTHRDMKVA
uniref:Lipid droplet-associated hydrolase n=1 Tax=Oryzias sinensis TaxID=183150 RepID=A0A8C7YGV8_9TELE